MKKLSEAYTELGIAFDFPIILEDKNGNVTYVEDSNGYWSRREYDASGNLTYLEGSNGYWSRREYDASGNETYLEGSNGYWSRREYDASGNETYCGDSSGEWSRYEYDASGNITYYENSDGYKEGTPRSESCELEELRKDKERLDWLLNNYEVTWDDGSQITRDDIDAEMKED